jgi:hypothetical protein
MLVLALLAGVGLYFAGRWAQNKVEELPQAPANVMDMGDQNGSASDAGGPEIREPGDQTTDTENGDESASGPDIREPGDTGSANDLGELMGRLGEAVESAGEAMSASNIEGFDPSTVDTTMLPAFYGVMIGIANSEPELMKQWMSSELKTKISTDELAFPPAIEHRGYKLTEKVVGDDGSVEFTIEQTTYDPQLDEEVAVTWKLSFEQIKDQWLVTELSHSNG